MMAPNVLAIPNRSSRPLVGRQPTRCKCFVVASLQHQKDNKNSGNSDKFPSAACGRRQALTGLGIGFAALQLGTVAPSAAIAKGAEKKKEPTIINDPVALKAQFEAQYQQWSSGQFEAWLATQPETLKWQSTYNGTLVKLKGKAGAQQYFAMLNADLDIQSYKPLAIFVDNDGDEATVVVEAAGISRRTQQPFKTVFLHAYTVGPMGQILKFKETTDTALMAQLVPPPPLPAADAATADTGSAVGTTAATAGSAAVVVEPGSTARSA